MTKLSQVYLHSLTVSQVEDAVLAMGSTRHAQVALASLKLALRDAKQRGHRFDEGILEIKPPRHVAKARSFLDWEQVLELSSFMPEFIRRIVPIAALTGLRQGELFDLRENDLVLSEREVPGRAIQPERGSGDRSRSESYLIVRSGKTENAKRRVVLPATAVTLLREQLLARKHTRGGYVFPAEKGGRLDKSHFMERIYRPACVRAGLGKWVLPERDERHASGSHAGRLVSSPRSESTRKRGRVAGNERGGNAEARETLAGRKHYEGVTFHALRRTYVSLGAKAGLRQEVIERLAGWAPGTATEMWKLYRQVYESELDSGISMLDALVRETNPERKKEARDA